MEGVGILYQDESFVAVSKPGGLLCHRTPEAQDRVFLLQTVRELVGRHVFPVHRIDRAASGIVLFGLSSEDASLLQRSMQGDGSIKEYLALARGSTPQSWETSHPLTSDEGVVQPAHSAFVKVAEFSGLSLLAVTITTGRRHQIRRHLARDAHQILGDTTYGKGRINRRFREEYGLPRLFLHAARVRLPHPRSGAPVEIRAPLAPDLAAFLRRLPDLPEGLLDRL